MKKTLLLTVFLSFSALFANAQCDYINQDFEDWFTFPLEFQGVERDIETPDNHISYNRFLINLILIEFFGDPIVFDMFENQTEAFWGIEKSTDASTGQYAAKIQAESYIPIADMYTAFGCNEIHDVLKVDIKHVGNTSDTIYIYGVYDENTAGLPIDDQVGLDTMAAYFVDSMIFDQTTSYSTYTIPVQIGDTNVPVDSFSLIFFVAGGNGGYFLVDNVRIENNNTAVDNDNDGYNDDVDCDDNNAAVNPGATEVCNGIDDNCDGQVDEGLLATFYLDDDGDGYGDAAVSVTECSAPVNYVANADDCDDSSAAVNPSATEVCNGLDDNCDGEVDEGVINTYYLDADGDGFGNASSSVDECTAPANYVTNADDCNDSNPNEFPGQTWYADGDADGYGDGTSQVACQRPAGYYLASELDATTGDCEPANSAIYPNAPETCDGVDNDCNGMIDDNVTFQNYYFDGDGDGYGAGAALNDCQPPSGNYVLNADDCDDSNAAVNPGATEVCNGIDDNCDGLTDDGLLVTYYLDSDGDGFGTFNSIIQACSAPVGYVPNADDCDDINAAVNPGATEVCNGIDDNCNAQTDEGVQNTYYLDSDGDGFGTAATSLQACSAPADYVANADDCDDSNAAINPSATEICNGADDNCNAQTDEGVQNTYYLDSDGDGFGTSATSLQACSAPANYVSNDDDCDDSNAAINPNATEICNFADDNCNAQIDEGLQVTYYLDSDGDGFGDANTFQESCAGAPANYVINLDDCDDDNASIFPGATEIANNGIDEDCDGADLMTGTDELAALNIRVFPNPFSDRLQLENLPATGYTVRLLNIFGQNMPIDFGSNHTWISSHDLPTGTYFVQITENSTARRKVVMVVKN